MNPNLTLLAGHGWRPVEVYINSGLQRQASRSPGT